MIAWTRDHTKDRNSHTSWDPSCSFPLCSLTLFSSYIFFLPSFLNATMKQLLTRIPGQESPGSPELWLLYLSLIKSTVSSKNITFWLLISQLCQWDELSFFRNYLMLFLALQNYDICNNPTCLNYL